VEQGNKALGPFLLSGLMIGPILGSGIIILPPLVYEVLGEWALVAWGVMVCVSFFFATLFGRLSLLFPGDAGVAAAMEHAFGAKIKRLSSLYLIGAVLFGPVAVLLTAGQYLERVAGLSGPLFGMIMLVACVALLLRRVTSIGRVSLVLSSTVAATLFVGGLVTLLLHRKAVAPLPRFSPAEFGYGMLLLFWTVVGWEVVGSYSGEVKDPDKTIPRAVLFSVCIMALVSLTVAAGVQMIDPGLLQGRVSVADLLRPLFGPACDLFMAVLVSALCLTSYLLFTGSVARLMASLAEERFLPGLLAQRSTTNAPAAAILLLGLVHLATLIAVQLRLADIKGLVALADGFFIANALIGILAAYRLLPGMAMKTTALLLAAMCVLILWHAHAVVLAIIAAMAVTVPLTTIVRRRRIY
jgi:APA family basic amino acid/polyamine antiporter